MKTTRNPKGRNEAGSAMIEFVLFGLVAQVAILVFAMDLLGHQKIQMAVETAARQAARAAALGVGRLPDLSAIKEQQTANFNLEPGRLSLELAPSRPEAGDVVTATASIDGVTASSSMRVPR